MGGTANEAQFQSQQFSEPAGPTLRLLLGAERSEGTLRSAARLATARAQLTLPLSWLWQGLAAGRLRAVDSYCEDGRCSLIVHDAPVVMNRRLTNERNLSLLKRVVLGEPQKIIALEFGVSASTVAGVAAQWAHAVGFSCCASRIPTLVLMAAHAAADPSSSVVADVAHFMHHGARFSAVSTKRPDPAIWNALSPAEREIVDLLVDRKSNAEIASTRRTAERTVANQIGNVMRKLRVRGRQEVLARLIELGASLAPAGNVDAPLA